MVRGTRNRASLTLVYTAAVFGLAACGGGSSAKVGDCTNAKPDYPKENKAKVVSCNSPDARFKLNEKVPKKNSVCNDGSTVTIDGTYFCETAKK